MFVRWLQRVFFGEQGTAPGRPAQTTDADRQTVDVVREAMKSQAAQLGNIVAAESAQAKREERKRKAKAKVQESIDPAFADEFLVDEITERIVDAAEHDPHFRHFTD